MNRIPSTDAGASKTNTRPTLVVNNSRRYCFLIFLPFLVIHFFIYFFFRRRTQSTENKSKLSTESTNIDKFYSEKNMDAENECIVRNEDTITVLAEAPSDYKIIELILYLIYFLIVKFVSDLSPSPSFNASPSKPLISVDDLKHRTLDPTLYRVVPLETLRQMNNANDDLAKRDDDFPKRDDRTQTTLRKNLRVNFSTENDLERPCESAVFNNVSNYIKNRPFVDHNFQMDYDNASMNLNDDLDSIRHTLFQARQSSSVVPEVPKLPVHYPHINTFTPESNNDIDRVKYERPVTRPKKHLVSKTVNHPQKSVTYLTRKVCSCKPNKKSKTESKQTMLNKCRAPKSSNCLTSQFSANRDHSINSSYVKKLLKDGIDAYKSALDVSSNIDLQNNSVTKIITRDTSPKKLVNVCNILILIFINKHIFLIFYLLLFFIDWSKYVSEKNKTSHPC